MNTLAHKLHNRSLRAKRVRSKFTGTTERPRLSVHITNRHVIAQIIDDSNHNTIAYVSTVARKAATGTMSERAAWVGTEIAKKAQAKKVKQVVFDRGGHLYHGRVSELATAARAAGLEF
jgi:large subunit ribosomal protein L18